MYFGGGDIPWVVVALWGACSLICGQLAKRSGRDVLTGAWVGLIFGPFGVMYFLTAEVRAAPNAPDPLPPYQVAVYRGATQAEAARAFAADAPRAAARGYEPMDRAWDGTTLTVTYRLR